MQRIRPLDKSERRKKIRYPLALFARCAIEGSEGQEVAGMTVNMSSNGILMKSEVAVAAGSSINVLIEWPLVRKRSPLVLHIRGMVVRCADGLLAAHFAKYEIRIGPKPPESEGVAAARICSRSTG